MTELKRAFFIFTAALAGLVCTAGAALAADTASKVICRLETDQSVILAGASRDLVLKVSLDAPEAPARILRPRVNVALVLDQSGSMDGVKIDRAKAAAIEALGRLGRQDLFSLVVYDTNVQTLVPAQHPVHVPGIIQTINQIHAGGNTALFGGVSQGAAQIRRHLDSDYVHRIILLSDGLANVGPRMPQDLGRLGAALLKEKISVTTVGVGVDYNEDLMARLAQKSDGNTYFVESGLDLPGIFAAELGEVLNVVAKQVRVIITLPQDATPLDIIGREGRIRGRQIELFMNQLYGGQEKYALIKVRLPKGHPGKKIRVAHATAHYENPFSNETETVTGAAHVAFTSDAALAERSSNINVVREYQLNLNALAQEAAITLSDQGKQPEAVRQLKQSAAKLKALGNKYKDEVLLEEADTVADQAQAIEKEGMSKKSRKLLRTESFQIKNQQMKK